MQRLVGGPYSPRAGGFLDTVGEDCEEGRWRISEATTSGTGSLPASQSRTSLGHTPSFWASRTCPQAMRCNSRLSCAGVNRSSVMIERPPCGRVPPALRSKHSVSALRRRPRGLRLMEEVQQLPLSELSEGCVGTLRSQRRIASEATLALGAGPQLEQQPKFILPVNRDAARGINLPDRAVYHEAGSCHTGTRRYGRERRADSSPAPLS